MNRVAQEVVNLESPDEIALADRMKAGIRGSELVIFDGCAHAPLYEKVEEFNQKTLEFLQRHAGAAIA